MARQVPTAALAAYARGMMYRDRGEDDRAALRFDSALQVYPQYTEACVALHELRPAQRC